MDIAQITDTLRQDAVTVVFLNVLLQQVGLPVPAVPTLLLAGSLAAKKRAPLGSNSFPTHGPLFVTLLVLTILLVGGLTFLPALALGPLAEHLAF